MPFFLAAFLAVVCPSAHADHLDWSFSLLPGEEISGPPGSTIGWGYRITNLETSEYLVPVALDADLFQHATPLNIFDFPIVAPGQTVSVQYNVSIPLGFYQLTWDTDAPLGFVNSGIFTLTADWYDANPLAGGNPVEFNSIRTAPYRAVVGNAIVPEPSSFLMATSAVGLLGIASFRRHRRSS